MTTQRLDSRQLLDAFSRSILVNRMTGLGTARDKSQYSQVNPAVYGLTREELSGLYRKTGVIQRAVTTYPYDSQQIWCNLNFGKSSIPAEDIQNYARKLSLREHISKASLYSRWFGDGYILMGIADGGNPNEEVDKGRIKTIRWLKTFSRWDIRPVLPLNGRYEDTEFYEIIGLDVPEDARVWHKSRVLRIPGTILDDWGLRSQMGANDSIIQSMYESFCAYYPGVQSLSVMVQDHRLRKFGAKGLAEATNQSQIAERVEINDLLRSTTRTEVYDLENEAIDNLTNQYTGLDKCIDKLEESWASDTDMSRIVLFNQIGKTNLTSGEAFKLARLDHTYRLNSWQDNKQRKPLETAFELIMLAADAPTKGKIIDGWTLTFPLNYQMTEDEKIALQKVASERDEKYINIGVYDAEVARRQFKSSEFNPNITFESGDEVRLNEPKEVNNDTDRSDAAWGVWFGGRRTPICVQASDRSEAISKAHKKKKRGGDNVDSARLLKDSERKTANSGGWVRSGAEGEAAGYNPRKKGYGLAPRSDSRIPTEIIKSISKTLEVVDNDPSIRIDSQLIDIAESIIDGTVEFEEWEEMLCKMQKKL